jgi:CRP-like cAMP-binding protein
MKSSSLTLTRTLRAVAVLKSLSVGQLQRLQDLLTEVTFSPNQKIITQGEASDNLYIIAEGRVRITKHENGGEKHVMDLGQGAYFGERALLYSEPRAASVHAAECPRVPLTASDRLRSLLAASDCLRHQVSASTACKLLYISKGAFEEVLGSLQGIIDVDRQTREGIAHQKALVLEQEGLAHVQVPHVWEGIEGVACASEPFQYTLAKLKGREYTVRVASKDKIVQSGLHARVMAEKELVSTLVQEHRMVPLALMTLQDESTLFTVYKPRVAIDLASLMGESGFDEATARFYTAGVRCFSVPYQRPLDCLWIDSTWILV